MTRRKAVSTGFVGLIAVLAVAAIAWACTPSAYLFPVSPSTGTAGSEVTVRGGQFGTGPVEIRWASENGRLLGTALGPDFSTKVTIPDKADGVHYIVAVARDPADSSKILARRAEAFQMKSAERSANSVSSSLWSDARQPLAEQGRFPAAAAGVALAGTVGAMGLFTLVLVRRRKAQA